MQEKAVMEKANSGWKMWERTMTDDSARWKMQDVTMTHKTAGVDNAVFGRPFLKWFTLCYRTVVRL